MKKLSVLSALLLLASCTYPFSVELEDTEERSLVVDANILIGNTSTVRLSYLQPLQVGQRGSAAGRPSANVFLEDEKGNAYQAVDNYGTYTIPAFASNGSEKYRLTVVADGKTYRSEWVEPVAPPKITDLAFRADDKNVYLELSMEDDGNGSGYAASVMDEIWNFHVDYVRQLGFDKESASVITLMVPDESHYWCWRKRSVTTQSIIDYSGMDGKALSYVLSHFSRSDSRNHREYHAKIKLWNLTKEQYEYRKMLEENASIGGNLFSPEPGEVRGNLYCENNPSEKVFGYVNISQVVTREISLGNEYFVYKGPSIKLIEVAPEDYIERYNKGYMPVDYFLNADGVNVPGWGQARCYDCIEAGGTLEKPDFE